MKNVPDLGLKSGTVKLLDHSVLWEAYANKAINELKNVFHDFAVDIQHTGSTAIKHIKAKPIIDIIVGVNDLNGVSAFIENLAKINYFHRPFKDEDFLFVKDNKDEKTRTHHIHIVKYKSDTWNDQINFRDYLNSNPTEAKNYECIKVSLEKLHENNRIKYTEQKSDYIIKTINKAREWKNSVKA